MGKRPPTGRFKVAFGLSCFAAGAIAMFVLLQLTRPSASRTNADVGGEPRATAPERVATAPAPRRIERPFLVRSAAPSCPSEDAEREQSYRVQQSRELVGLLRDRLVENELRGLPGGPEAVVNAMTQFIDGWTESTLRVGPDLVEEIASEIEATLCDPRARPTQLLLMSRVLRQLPDFANPRALDCVFSRGREDIVLWEALDAWRMGDLPKSEAFARVVAQASDERTQRRLTKWADELAVAAESPEPAEAEPSKPSPSGATQEAALQASLAAGQMSQAQYETAIAELRACERGDCNDVEEPQPQEAIP